MKGITVQGLAGFEKNDGVDYINFDYFQKEAFEAGVKALKKRLLGEKND